MWQRSSVQAELRDDGLYNLTGGTFDVKETIKEYGGRWDPEYRVWVCDRECAEAVGAHFAGESLTLPW
jgi:hypothetical protein